MSEIENTLFDKIEELSIEVKNRRKELNRELSQIDREITDIEHYIEFYSLSASKGYMCSKMLKERFERRRSIKNEMEELSDISMMQIGFISKGKGRERLEKRSDKKYTPRILKELFNE